MKPSLPEPGYQPLAGTQTAYWQEHSATNCAAFVEHLARSCGRPWARWDDVWAADPDCPMAYARIATLLRPLPGDRAEELLARLDQFYGEVPYMLWNHWPLPEDVSWGLRLALNLQVMVRPPGAVSPVPLPDLRIVDALDATAVADGERTLVDGYPLADLQPLQAGILVDARSVAGQLRIFVGYVDDRPVTTAWALPDETATGIYMVATLPAARQRGYGSAITAHAVAHSPSLPAVLQSTAGGAAIYRRLGFTEVSPVSIWMRAARTR